MLPETAIFAEQPVSESLANLLRHHRHNLLSAICALEHSLRDRPFFDMLRVFAFCCVCATFKIDYSGILWICRPFWMGHEKHVVSCFSCNCHPHYVFYPLPAPLRVGPPEPTAPKRTTAPNQKVTSTDQGNRLGFRTQVGPPTCLPEVQGSNFEPGPHDADLPVATEDVRRLNLLTSEASHWPRDVCTAYGCVCCVSVMFCGGRLGP